MDDAYRERDIEAHSARADPSHDGHPFSRTFRDSFEIVPEKHLCLVNEPLRELFWIFQKRFTDKSLSSASKALFIYSSNKPGLSTYDLPGCSYW